MLLLLLLLLLCLLGVYGPSQLSTDGQYLAYIKPAPETNVANVFIRELPKPISRSRVVESARSSSPARMARDLSIFERDGTNSDRQITFDSNQGVSSYSWSEDSSSIVYIQDSNGDENYHLHLVPVANPGEAIDLTPFPGVKAQDILSSELHPDKLYIVSVWLAGGLGGLVGWWVGGWVGTLCSVSCPSCSQGSRHPQLRAASWQPLYCEEPVWGAGLG
jgi:Tol biopolymer transport system component